MRVRESLRVAARLWRSEFWLVTATLAILPAVWAGPRLLLARLGILTTGPLLQSIVAIVDSIWWSPVLAAQMTFCLVLCRTGRVAMRPVLVGLRQTPKVMAFWILVSAALELAILLPVPSEDDLQWSDGLFLIVLPAVFFVIVRIAFAPALIADLDLSVVSALRRSWVLTQGRSWLMTRLFIVPVLGVGMISWISGWQAEVAGVVYSLSLSPLTSLGYTMLYLSASENSLAPNGDTPGTIDRFRARLDANSIQ